MMTCQLCGGDGEVTETHLVGDGIPGVSTRIESEVVECYGCGGQGYGPDPEDPGGETP